MLTSFRLRCGVEGNKEKEKLLWQSIFSTGYSCLYVEKSTQRCIHCVMGITLNDIYPGDNWNFVYGWAKYKARVGIFSFLRWDDEFASGQTE